MQSTTRVTIALTIPELAGREVVVRRATRKTMAALQRLGAETQGLAPPEQADLPWRAAHLFVPDLTDEEIDGLTQDSAQKILELATMGIADLERILGESLAPSVAAPS